MTRKNLEDFLDLNTPSDKLDKLMKEILQEKFDKELKAKYENILANDYNVHRTQVEESNSNSKPLIIVLFTLLTLALAGYFVMQNLRSDKNQVNQYLAENQLHYQGTTRNETANFDEIMSRAYVAFNQSQYKEFLQITATLSDLSKEDLFFRGYARMRVENYKAALQDFESVLKETEPQQKYYEELLLYKAICLQKLDQASFDKFYQKLNKSSWAKDELNKIAN